MAHRTRRAAAAAAEKASGYLADGDGILQPDGTWEAVILLREDQGWMRDRVSERGVRVEMYRDQGVSPCV